MLMGAIDSSIVIIALPSIGKGLPGITPIDLIWVVIGYQLVLAVMLVNFGRLGDILGRVRLYKYGFAIFTLASALCGLSQTGAELVAFRCMQGVGASLLSANANAIVTDAFSINERGRALSFNNVASASGQVLGLVLGGILAGTLGWRSIFWVNIPIGIVAVAWSHYHLRELGEINRKQKIDVSGNVLFLTGMTLLLAAVTLYALSLLGTTTTVAMVGFGLLAMVLFVYVESRAPDPMIKVDLFKIPSFTLGNIAGFLNTLARGSVSLVIALYLQGPTMNLSPTTAGLYVLPLPIALALVAPPSGYLSDRHGQKILTTTGALVVGSGCVYIAQFGPTVTFVQILIGLTLVGAGTGLFVSPNRSSIMNSSPADQRGVASGIYQTSIQIGNVCSRAFAFVIMGLILSSANIDELFNGTLRTGGSLISGELVSALHLIYYSSAVLCVIIAAISALRISTFNYSRNIPSNKVE
jgi:EmrB/QacA subfamily drug resistance transporter